MNTLEANSPPSHDESVAKNKSVSRRVLRGGMLLTVSKFSGIGAALISNISLARLIDADDFGLFILLVTIINFGAILGRAGLDRALVIYIAKNIAKGNSSGARDAFRMGMHVCTVASLTAGGLIFGVLCVGGERLFELPGSVSLMASVAVGVLLMSRLNVLAESLCGYHDLLFCSLFESQSGGLLMNVAFLVLLSVGFPGGVLSINVVMWLFVLSIGVLLPMAAFRLHQVAGRHRISDTVNTCELTERRVNEHAAQELTYSTMLALCMPLMFSQVLNFASSRTDIWIAGACCSHSDLAIFGVARRLTFLISMPLMVVNHSVLSSIPELYSQNRIAELQRILRISSTIAAIPVMVVLLPMILLPGTILGLVYGEFYSSGASILVILSCGQLAATLTGSCGSCLLMTGHHRTMIIASLAGVVVLFGAGALAATAYGAIGLAIVCAITMAGKNVWWLIAARVQIGVWTQVTIPREIPSLRGLREMLNR
jgi:O-antigen/teichoic acid export membrane protein